jgi:hypothetical protein
MESETVLVTDSNEKGAARVPRRYGLLRRRAPRILQQLRKFPARYRNKGSSAASTVA